MAANECVLQVQHIQDLQNSYRHHHNGYQLIYIKQGAIRLTVGNRCYTAGVGDMIVINYLEIHTVQVIETPYDRYFVLLSPHQLMTEIKDQKLLYLFSNRPPNFSHVIPMGEWQTRAQTIFSEMEEEYQNREQRELSGEWLTCCIRELLILLYRLCSSSYTFIHTSHGHIWEVKQYIEQHCTEEDLSISAVAETFYSSIYYLTHTFKKVTGYTPKQYLQLCRLAAARELLYETDYNITEISQRAGFSDINNFIRYFKREVGVTPGQYRKGLADKREDSSSP